MVQENDTPEVTQAGVEEAQTEVPAKEDVVVKTEGSAEPAPHAAPDQPTHQRPRGGRGGGRGDAHEWLPPPPSACL
jgi:hypothetical protein